MSVVQFSPAKINLYLHILGKREDGYHLLDSIFSLIDLSDKIAINKNNQTKTNLIIKGDLASAFDDNNIQENIIIKTINLLEEELGHKFYVDIMLEKNIPIGAGLGGGSSNAATTLIIINQLYELNLSISVLHDLALKIGADVPFFLYGKAKHISGIGEIINDVNLFPNLPIIIIYPNQHLNTAMIFKNFSLDLAKSTYNLHNQFDIKNSYIQNDSKSFIEFLSKRNNDLTDTAIGFAENVGNILDYLSNSKYTKIARMSGSGSSCFALFDNINDCDTEYKNLKKYFPDFYITKSWIRD